VKVSSVGYDAKEELFLLNTDGQIVQVKIIKNN